MIAQSNVTHFFVGKDLATALITDTRETLEAGQIGVFKVGSQTATGVNALSAGDRYQVVLKKTDGSIIESPVCTYGTEGYKASVDYTAPTYQSTTIGFNGTSGTIDVANVADYVVHLFYKDDTKTWGGSNPGFVKFAAYRSDEAATQVEIADGVTKNFIKNFKKETLKPFKFETLINNVGAVITGTGNLTATNGSRFLVAATDADAVVSVGDYLRLGTAAGAALTDGAYKVVSFPAGGQYIELDREFQGASATYTEANCDYIAAATAAGADAGIKITALPLTDEFAPGILTYETVHFNVELKSDFGTTEVTKLSASTKGSGTYEEIAETEWFLKANRGEPFRVADYPVANVLESVKGETYDLISFGIVDSNARSLDRDVKSFGTVMIATPDGGNDANAGLKTILGIS